MKRLLYGPFIDGRGAAALLILRVLTGAGLMMHGWSKIQNPFGWMGANATVPAPLQFLAAISEFFGGLAFIVGLLTPIAALGVICTMCVAAFGAMGSAPIMAAKAGEPSKEPALFYLTSALTLLLIGPGRFSLDALFFGSRMQESEAQTAIPNLRHRSI